MKKIFATVAVWLVGLTVFAQNDSLLSWKVVAKKNAQGIYELTANAILPQGWHVYGSNPTVEGLETVKFVFDLENVQLQNATTFTKNAETITDAIFENKTVNVYTGAIEVKQLIKINGFVPAQLQGSIEAFVAKGDEFLPQEKQFDITLEGGAAVANDVQKIKIATIDINHPVAECGEKVNKKDSLLAIFFIGFLGGLIALLTPCVFPMIPVTVSFFTKKSGNRKQAIRNGILYGLFILLIYVLASTPFHLLDNVQPEILNNISTNAWLNVFFFIVFIVFAISFFGYFEITLPSSVANRADTKSSLGSIGGIFFMALTLVIVSFSCTGIILGTLLVGTAGSGAWALTTGMAGFGAALALPFALFAIFPSWLQSLPKSGGWLDTVKKVLAFVELALAFKFLSNADSVMHWGILKREIFFAIWILISGGLFVYLMGWLRLPHDYKGMKITNGRKVFGILALVFTLYLIPGVTNTAYANLKLLSGFPPPLHYSIYGTGNIHGKGLEADVMNDYDKALQLAKAQDKPLLLDFTGWACTNCRKMEENVWTKPEVYNYIKEHFILVSLYVDDKQKLPIEQRFTYTNGKLSKTITTIGDKWSTFQSENFVQVSQPLYVVLNTNEKLMTYPVGYTPNAQEYLQWLQCGYESFKKEK